MTNEQIKHLTSNSWSYSKLTEQIAEHPTVPYREFVDCHIIMKNDFDLAISTVEISDQDRLKAEELSNSILAKAGIERSVQSDLDFKSALDSMCVIYQRLVDHAKSQQFRDTIRTRPSVVEVSEITGGDVVGGKVLLEAQRFYFFLKHNRVTPQIEIVEACVNAISAFKSANENMGEWLHVDTWRATLEKEFGAKTNIKEVFHRSDRQEPNKSNMRKLLELAFESSADGIKYRLRSGVEIE